MNPTTDAPLRGIKVVELASVLAGPSVGMFLAELGAEVIKVENPATGGDTTRQWKTPDEAPESPVSAYYASANWGKRVVSLDLKNPEDLRQVNTWLLDADILLVNFKPGDELKFGLSYHELKLLYPKLIVGKITGFPESDRPAFDIVLQAETGFMSLNGTQQSGPLKWPLPVIDILAAHQLKEGLLLALLQRHISGAGALVEVSLYDTAIASLTNIGTNVLMGGMDPVSAGHLHANIAPYGETIATSDGETIVLAVGTDAQFAALCKLLGASGDFMNEFSTNQARVNNRQILGDELRRLARKLSFNVLNEGLIAHKVPFGRIRTVRTVLNELPAHYFLEEEIEGQKTVRLRTRAFTIRT